MLQKEIKRLTRFIAGEAKILEARPLKLNEAFEQFLTEDSVLDREIPSAQEDDKAIEEKLERIISELKSGSSARPDKKSLNLAAYYLTAPSLNLGWSAKRTILSSIASVIHLPGYRSTVRNLVYGYIQFFDPNSRATKDLARLVAQNQESLNSRWKTRISKFGMLDSSSLLKRISEEILEELPRNFFDRRMTLLEASMPQTSSSLVFGKV